MEGSHEGIIMDRAGDENNVLGSLGLGAACADAHIPYYLSIG